MSIEVPGAGYDEFGGSYFDFVSTQALARYESVVNPFVIPGELQTHDYATAYINLLNDAADSRKDNDTAPPVDAEGTAEDRLAFFKKLVGAQSLATEIYMDESSLRHPNIDERVMAGQLRHLKKVIKEHASDTFTVGIRPTLSQPLTAARIIHIGNFKRFETADGDIIWRDRDGTDIVPDDALILPHYRTSLSTYREHALREDAAIGLIDMAMRSSWSRSSRRP